MRALVCGGRDFPDHQFVFAYLSARLGDYIGRPDLVLIHGVAKGVDSYADLWARTNGVKVEPYLAEWAKYSRQAGYLRNRRMLVEGKPDLIIAFPGGVGTAMMVEMGRDAHVTVELVGYKGSYVPRGASRDYASFDG